jgi:hypothetical protein
MFLCRARRVSIVLRAVTCPVLSAVSLERAKPRARYPLGTADPNTAITADTDISESPSVAVLVAASTRQASDTDALQIWERPQFREHRHRHPACPVDWASLPGPKEQAGSLRDAST